jgi:glycosyltransferase involved in cell wall biosynthesis
MRAIHIIAGIRPEDGGPAYSVPRLCREIAAAGAEVDLMTVSKTPKEILEGNYRERHFDWSHSGRPLLQAVRASSALAQTLRRELCAADVLHNHGLWLMPNVYAGTEARRARRALVVAPRGMLSPAALSFSRFKKRGFWYLLQRQAVSAAVCFHATSEQEYQEIRAFGLRHPVAIIPNGIDIPPHREKSAAAHEQRTILSLGRLHPKKGLDILLRAWARVEPDWPDWRLRIVGPSEAGHEAVLKSLSRELGLTRVSIEGAVYGAAKNEIYDSAGVFVLPTLNDNFAITVAEALAAGIPVIASKGAPWSGLVEERCGWWIDHGIEPLAAALSEAMAWPKDELDAMGARGRAWMARDFSWPRAGRDVIELYKWLTGVANMPGFVRHA